MYGRVHPSAWEEGAAYTSSRQQEEGAQQVDQIDHETTGGGSREQRTREGAYFVGHNAGCWPGVTNRGSRGWTVNSGMAVVGAGLGA